MVVSKIFLTSVTVHIHQALVPLEEISFCRYEFRFRTESYLQGIHSRDTVILFDQVSGNREIPYKLRSSALRNDDHDGCISFVPQLYGMTVTMDE